MNYADDQFQAKDVWDGYGAENLARLRNIQKIVDPTGIFTRGGLASGYFKLNSLNGS
jgi:FAD/FMN-containing dehydrogenase